MPNFPSALPAFSTKNDGPGNVIAAAHVNDLQSEVVELGRDLISGLRRPLRLEDATEATTASGAITVTRGYIKIDTEADAAADDLITVTPGANVGAGSICVFRAENVARVVTLKDGGGNLLLSGDYALDATDKTLTAIYDGANWREMARSGGTQAGVGPWTPVIGGAGGTSGQAYTTQSGLYIKIDRLVVAWFSVHIATEGTITGSAEIQGFPFAVEAVTNGHWVAIQYRDLATTWVNVGCQMGQGSVATAAALQGSTVAAANNINALTASDIQNGTRLFGCVMYRTAA